MAVRTDYPNNSDSNKEKVVTKKPEVKEAEEAPKKVVSAKPKVKKKSEVANAFISDDAKNVKNYIIFDVLIPSMKKALSDIITDGIDMILFGETRSTKKVSQSTRVSYGSYYASDSRRDRNYRSTYDRTPSRSYENLIFESRADAEAVLDAMLDVLDRYQIVSVSDMYEFADMSSNYTDNNLGWDDLSNARIERVRDGYRIRLPRPIPLD